MRREKDSSEIPKQNYVSSKLEELMWAELAKSCGAIFIPRTWNPCLCILFVCRMRELDLMLVPIVRWLRILIP